MNLKTYSRFTAALAFAISANRNAMRPANRRAPKGVCLPLLLLSFFLAGSRASAQIFITATPAALDFGAVTIGKTGSQTVSFVVSSVYVVDALTITGANADRFQILSPHFVDAPDASFVGILFTQTAAGSSAATLNIPYHVRGFPMKSYLTTVSLAASPAPSLDFGAVPSGQTKDLTYTGTLPVVFFGTLTGASLAITGANAGDFQIVSQDFIGKTLGGYSVVVRFHPMTDGTRFAALEIVTKFRGAFTNSDSYDTVTIPLTGMTTGAPAVTVTGFVALEGVSDLRNIASAATQGTFHATFRTLGATAIVYGADFTLSATSVKDQGAFTVSGVPTGLYDITLQGWKNLRVLLPRVNIYAGVALPLVTLPGGDANGDNRVDSADFALLIGAYNSDSSAPGSGYNGNADFNLDGVVDATDFGLFVGNFNAVGAQ